MRMWQTQLDNLCTSIDYFWSLQPSWSQPSWTQDTCILGLVYKWTNYYRKYELGLPILVTDYIDYHSQETEEITETASWWDWYRQIGFNCPPGLLGGLAGPWCLPRPPLNKQVRPWPKVTGALFHPLSLPPLLAPIGALYLAMCHSTQTPLCHNSHSNLQCDIDAAKN